MSEIPDQNPKIISFADSKKKVEAEDTVKQQRELLAQMKKLEDEDLVRVNLERGTIIGLQEHVDLYYQLLGRLTLLSPRDPLGFLSDESKTDQR
jgi:hypothetical protein